MLGIALLIPANLPAGGYTIRQPQIKRTNKFGPIITTQKFCLKSSPFSIAPTLRTLDIGSPLHVLRVWQNNKGQKWIHVQLSLLDKVGQHNLAQKGWLNV